MATKVEALSDNYTEKLNQWGLFLSVCTYGAHVALFSRYLLSFSKQRTRNRLLLVYTIVLFMCATTAIGLQIWWTQVVFIDNRYYPGGPQQFLTDNYYSAPNRALTMMYVVMNWLADGIILYRFYVLCACMVIASRSIALLFVIPCSTALVVVAMVFFPNITSLGVNLWTGSPSTAPGIAYMALSLCVNTILTLLIIFRLVLIRRSLQQILGTYNGQPYTSLLTLLIESAAPYTIVALMTVIACGVGSPIQYVLLPMLGQLQAIPPVLITSRVAEGLALSKSKYSELSTSQVRFNARSHIRSMFSTLSSSSSFESPPITPMKPSLKLDLPGTMSSSESFIFSQDIHEKSFAELTFTSPSVLSGCEIDRRHRCSELCRNFCREIPGVGLGGDASLAV